MSVRDRNYRVDQLEDLCRRMMFTLRQMEEAHEESPGNSNDTFQCCPLCHQSTGHAGTCDFGRCVEFFNYLGLQELLGPPASPDVL